MSDEANDQAERYELVIDCHSDDEANRTIEWLVYHRFDRERMSVRNKDVAEKKESA